MGARALHLYDKKSLKKKPKNMIDDYQTINKLGEKGLDIFDQIEAILWHQKASNLKE